MIDMRRYLFFLFLMFRGADALVGQAKEWEASGEYSRAVDCYLKVTTQQTNDDKVLRGLLDKGETKIDRSDLPQCHY